MHPARFFLALALFVGACAHRAPYDYRSEPDPNQVQYVLGPGDVVEVRQWKNADVSGRLRVMPDGTITVPLLGPLKVAGLTVQKVRDRLSAGLAKFITQPAEMQTLTISVDEYQSYAISVLGEVNQPGRYQPGHYVTVLEALALAHGLSPYAQEGHITLLRRAAGQQRRIPISYKALIRGKHPEMNIYMLRGDVLIIP